MKVILAQINSSVGDFSGNRHKMAGALEKASDEDLVIFPECCLTGYPQQDLLEYPDFAQQASAQADMLVKDFPTKNFIFGTVEISADKGRPLRNAALFVQQSKIVARYFKRLLPTYDVFDEDRFFEPGRESCIVNFKGLKIALTICEDIWSRDLGTSLHNRYLQDPLEDSDKADLIINISASPFEYQKVLRKREMLSRIAQEQRKTLIYVNAVGANDSIIFDGRSYVLNASGEVCHSLKAFKEDFVSIDINNLVPTQIEEHSQIEDIYDALILGIKDYCLKTGFSSVVLGLSGGIDSSLVACLAADALGAENVVGVMMPSRYTSKESNEDALGLAVAMQCPLHILAIEEIYGASLRTLALTFENLASDVTEENLQSRIRGMLLMALANKFRLLLLTTGNKSELAVGYCTLYGDMNGALAPICDVYKTQVYELAREANRRAKRIPERVFTKPPSAELRENQTDQDSLPSYEVLDGILKLCVESFKTSQEIEAAGYSREDVTKVIRLLAQSEFKRYQMPLGLKISSKAFGVGRRIPLVHQFFKNHPAPENLSNP